MTQIELADHIVEITGLHYTMCDEIAHDLMAYEETAILRTRVMDEILLPEEAQEILSLLKM